MSTAVSVIATPTTLSIFVLVFKGIVLFVLVPIILRFGTVPQGSTQQTHPLVLAFNAQARRLSGSLSVEGHVRLDEVVLDLAPTASRDW
jgi:hypothetical protein